MKLEDLSGKRFGHLVVIEKAERNPKSPSTRWCCLCDCGNKTFAYSFQLKNRKKMSCGCMRASQQRESVTTHGGRYTRLYRTWVNMKQRTGNPKHEAYPNYGGRGIRVCEEWISSFERFRDWAISTGYNDDLTIDRINVDGNYEPSNCRWITKAEQNRNQRSNVLIEYNGVQKTMSEWAAQIGISESALHQRINVLHWSIERAITTPKKVGEHE